MTPNHDGAWTPDPELLAAYFDGEFEGRDELAPLRRRLEEWLTASADARAELTEYRRLRQLWLATTPVGPSTSTWCRVLKRLDACAAQPATWSGRPTRPRPWKTSALWAGAAAVLLAAFLIKETAPSPEDDEAFPVASAGEVIILHVEGADTGTLVVGELPLQGPMELAGPGDVTLTSVAPAQGDNMVPEVHVTGPGRPIIWARAEADDD